MTIQDEEHTRDKLQYYFDKGESVHITLTNGYFYNGITLSFNDTNIIFEDERVGEMIIFLSEISNVQKREERR